MSLEQPFSAFDGIEPRLGRRVFVHPAATVIGRVRLGDDASIWPGAVLRGDVEEIRIGPRSNIQDASICHVTHDGPWTPGGAPLTVGADVTVGHRVVLHACTIGDGCLIGIGAIVMDEVEIEAGVLVAAGALVPPGKRLRAGTLWRGSPAREVRELTAREHEQLAYSAAHYVRLKDRYLAAAGESGDA